MIAQGKHEARAVDHEFGVSKEKRTRFLRIHFEILSGEHKGHRIFWDGWLTEKTAERTMESMEACGWDGASLSRPTGIGSADCEIDVGHEEHEGKTYAKVKWVNRPGAMKLKEEFRLDERSLSELDQEFRATLLERKQKNGGGARRPTPKPAAQSYDDRSYGGASPADDDLPF